MCRHPIKRTWANGTDAEESLWLARFVNFFYSWAEIGTDDGAAAAVSGLLTGKEAAGHTAAIL